MGHAMGHKTPTHKLAEAGTGGIKSSAGGAKESAASKGSKRDGHQGCGVC